MINPVFNPQMILGTLLAWFGVLVVVLILIAGFLVLGYILLMLFKYRKREKTSLDSVLLQVALPRDNEIKIDAAEQMFASFYSIRKHYSTFMTVQPHISFEIVG